MSRTSAEVLKTFLPGKNAELVKHTETKLSSTSTDIVPLKGFEEGPDDTDLKSTVNDMRMHALDYLAGWMAKKLKDDFPYLVENKEDERSKVNTTPGTAEFSWTKHLLYGRLCIPLSEWFTQAIKLNEGFQNHHGENIVKGADVVKNLQEILYRKYPNDPTEVIKTFLNEGLQSRTVTPKRSLSVCDVLEEGRKNKRQNKETEVLKEIQKVQERVAAATGVSLSSVYKILRCVKKYAEEGTYTPL
ncbi:hypothetical protein ANN_26769 [Periplaneta americana]|uniref:Transposable element P transposase-like C-terminal domain-containing protein n=1 Tax=Periplaneta americana TaxID=6978 RepID=A0ABQ8RZ63_PERAM|nr:hypothetical protein ANN_26769 [Periplaneta americana]